MPGPTVNSGTGATLVFTTTSWTAELLNINLADQTRESIETSHLGSTTYKSQIPGDLVDQGSVEVDFHWNPDSPPPITAVMEIVQIKYPLHGTITAASNTKINMFITKVGAVIPLENVMKGSLTLKCTGTQTHSNAA